MAATTVAAGKLNLAIHRGDSIPEGWIIDRDGKPTRRPEDYSGIEIDDASWQEITQIARDLGVEVPAPQVPPGDP